MSTHLTSNLGHFVQMQGNSYGKSCTLLIQIASIISKMGNNRKQDTDLQANEQNPSLSTIYHFTEF